MIADKTRREEDLNSLASEQRLTSLEQAVDHIEGNVGELKATLARGFEALHIRLDKQSEDSRPKLTSWAGWAAVCLVVISMLGSGYVRDLNRVELHIDVVDIRVQSLERELSALGAVTEYSHNQFNRRISEITNLRREFGEEYDDSK